MVRVRVSSKNQIVVPSSARKELGISPGDYLIAEVAGGAIVLIPEPESHVDALRGLGTEVWQDVDGDTYLERERNSWEERQQALERARDESRAQR